MCVNVKDVYTDIQFTRYHTENTIQRRMCKPCLLSNDYLSQYLQPDVKETNHTNPQLT